MLDQVGKPPLIIRHWPLLPGARLAKALVLLAYSNEPAPLEKLVKPVPPLPAPNGVEERVKPLKLGDAVEPIA